jgi:hypothetical protein
MMAKLQGSLGMGTKEDESGIGCMWAAGFHRVNSLVSLGARFDAYEPFISLIFLIFFWSHCQPQILNPRIRGSVCTCFSTASCQKVTFACP